MKKITLAILALTCALVVASGCDFPGHATNVENSEPYNVTIVGIGHSRAYSIAVENYKDDILRACDTAGNIVVIDTGSEPKAVFNVSIPSIDRSLPKAKQELILKEDTNMVISDIKKNTVTSGEVDVLAALVIAARTKATEIVVGDSGVNTTGDLDMNKGYLDENCIDSPEMIAQTLAKSGRLPDLSGRTIIWFGCGDTCGGQELSLRAVNRLKDIWSAVIEEAGGNVIFMNELPSSKECEGPEVSLINVYEGDIENPEFGPKIVKREYKESEKSELTFEPNKAEFLYKDRANEALCILADEMNNSYMGRNIVVIGTTATGDWDNAMRLSEARAEKVKETLVSYGVDAGRITCYGFGCGYSRRVDDIDCNGNLIENQAAQNRLVIIGDVEDKEICEILGENL